jgi:hypothetical protein
MPACLDYQGQWMPTCFSHHEQVLQWCGLLCTWLSTLFAAIGEVLAAAIYEEL